MPIFILKKLFDFNHEKSTLIAASCESNLSINDFSKSKIQKNIGKFSNLMLFEELFLLNILLEVNSIKIHTYQLKDVVKKYFCNFNQNNMVLLNENLLKNKINFLNSTKKRLKDIKKKKEVSKFDNNIEFYGKQNEIFIVEKEIYIFISKYKYRGCNNVDLKNFIEKSKIVSSKSKRLFSKFFLEYLKKIEIVKLKKETCYLNLKIKQYIIKNNYSNLWEENKNLKEIKYKKKDFFIIQHFISIPPCLFCPVISECHVQSEINPFDCIYLKKWIYKKHFFFSLN